MKDLDKKSNNDLVTLKQEKKDKFEEVRLEIVKLYDYWKHIESEYYTIDKELTNRGL